MRKWILSTLVLIAMLVAVLTVVQMINQTQQTTDNVVALLDQPDVVEFLFTRTHDAAGIVEMQPVTYGALARSPDIILKCPNSAHVLLIITLNSDYTYIAEKGARSGPTVRFLKCPPVLG